MNQDQAFNENEENSTIERFPLTKDFTILSNTLLQDPDLSADASMVAIYILSLPTHKLDGTPWDIHPKHVWKNKNISRDRVYKAFNELIDAGYMEKIEKKRGNLRSKIIYRISCLKKFLRRPEIQDTEIQDPEIQDLIKDTGVKRTDGKKNNNKPPAVAAQAVVVFPIFDSLKIPQDMKVKFSSEMDQEKAALLVKRVLNWKDRESDAKGCNTVLKKWDTWSDETTAAEKEAAAKAEEETLKERDIARKAQVLGLRDKFPVLNIMLDDNSFGFTRANGKTSRVGYRDECFDFILRSIEKECAGV